MSMVEAEAQEEELQERPRRKTPLWLLALGGAGLLAIVVVGLRATMRVEPTVVKESTTHAVAAESSSMVRVLEQQRFEAEERERLLAEAAAQQKNAPVAGASSAGDRGMPAAVPAGASATGTYVPPTANVPRYAFGGGAGCDEQPTLKERLACLDSQFTYETRRVRLKELGDSLTGNDNLYMMGSERRGRDDGTADASDERRWRQPPPNPGNLWHQPTIGMGGSGGYGVGGAGGADERRPSQDSSVEFHRTGGASVRPERQVGELQQAGSRYWLRAGSILPCAFISGVTSQLPGQVEAQITQNVYDSLDHRHLLIPAGSMLVGRPNPETRQGQNRIQFAWTELHLPDGEFRELGGMAGADGAGLAGVEGRVDRHWGRKLGLALMTSTINVAFHLATPPSGTGQLQDAVSQGVGQGVVQTATEGLRNMMQIPDEIVIRPGQSCSVKVEQSMAFPRPYEDGKRWRR
jgi:type IV secretory pathway VirB10-like protein